MRSEKIVMNLIQKRQKMKFERKSLDFIVMTKRNGEKVELRENENNENNAIFMWTSVNVLCR